MANSTKARRASTIVLQAPPNKASVSINETLSKKQLREDDIHSLLLYHQFCSLRLESLSIQTRQWIRYYRSSLR